MGASDNEPIDVAPQRAAELIRDDAVQLVDVREDYEVEAGHLKGARHIGLAQLTEQAASIGRDKPILFYCRVGSRSAMAASAFRRAGYEAYSLTGGLVAWSDEGLPLVPEDGHVANH